MTTTSSAATDQLMHNNEPLFIWTKPTWGRGGKEMTPPGEIMKAKLHRIGGGGVVGLIQVREIKCYSNTETQ